jgi:methionyl-tRNA formyltransferase
MRIVLIGQAAFGAKALEALLENGETVVAAYAPPDSGGKADPLKEAALKRGIPVYQPKSYRHEEVYREFTGLAPDLAVLAFVTSIIPGRFFTAATRGAICYHPSLLPRHRGASAINWAVIMGDTRTGLTIFWPDSGIDTGPILLQKEIEIGPGDTTGSLYFNHLFPMGVEAIAESVRLIREGIAPKIVQTGVGATYEPPCDDRVAGVDWGKTGREIYNLIRGCDPQPGAYSHFQGERVRFYGAKLIAAQIAGGEKSPGTICAVDAAGIHIAVSGGMLAVGKVRPDSAGKMDGAEWAKQKNIGPGDRFETE